ncbi:MAG TPA: tetratricopeptide repeat protein [Aliiroseovarius sp.]|nr:tetratricopeptide repeat protein [Aliiroseovarius sp.]
MFKAEKDREVRGLAQTLAEEAQGYFDHCHMTPGRKKIVAQMLAQYPISVEDLARWNMQAAEVAQGMRGRVEDMARVPGRNMDPAHVTDTALADYQHCLATLLGPHLAPKTQSDAIQHELLTRSRQTGAYIRMLEAGISEKAILGLAGRIAGDTDDLEGAWATLEEAVDRAIRLQEDGGPSNHGEFVDRVMAEVRALSAGGEYDDADAAIEAALAEEEAAWAQQMAQREAARARLLAAGVDVAVLAGNAERAAELALAQADLEAGGRAGFDDLRKLQNGFYEKGRDKGIAIDLRIAIALAEHLLERAGDADERGTALNDLGIVLQSLGERESSPARLEAAVTAYENALKEWSRDRVPLDWAGTQNNLGNALSTLGSREHDPARLEAAVTAYENALKEWSRDRVPLQWATTQNNLGNALKALGGRDSDTVRLGAAVTAYENALKEWSRDRVPLNWAGTQNNLGNALQALGAREGDTERLEAAVTAYENALKERTRDRVPLDWAATQYNLAVVALAFFDLIDDPAHLDRAETHAQEARAVFASAEAEPQRDMCDAILAEIAARRDGGGG